MNTITTTRLIASQLEEAYAGKPWFGPSVKDKLTAINYDNAIKSIKGKKNIAAYVAHMLVWRKFVIEKLKGNASFTVKFDSEEDWPPTENLTETQWQEMMNSFETTHYELLQLLNNFPDNRLDEMVPGTSPFKYNYRHMLFGLLPHDIYHTGQVGLLHSMLAK